MKTALTIAGTDPSGGAGIQADIKTMTADGVFAACAVTALVAQNTTGVKGIMEVYAGVSGGGAGLRVHRYLARRGEDRHGHQRCLIRVIAAKLKEYEAENLVVDPVMVSTSGARLFRRKRSGRPGGAPSAHGPGDDAQHSRGGGTLG